MTHIAIKTPHADLAARFHAWRETRSVTTLLLLSLAWACLMGLLAQVRIALPFTPVPFTMQVFGILLGGVLLGARHGALAQFLYVGLGIAGIPWFQGSHGGLAYFLGPTGGYLLAAPIAAWLTGTLAQARLLRPAPRAFAAMLAGMLVVYALGMTWLAFALGIGLGKAFVLGVAPFLALDAAKAAAAAAMARPFVRE